MPPNPFSFIQPTYERKQQQEHPLWPISPQSAVASGLPVTKSFLSGPDPTHLSQSHLMCPVEGGSQFVQSNSYAAYGAENDPEQIPPDANAFSTGVPSDAKLASFFGGFGPMSPSQGKDFFSAGPTPVNTAVVANEMGSQPLASHSLPADQALAQGHPSRRTNPMFANPTVNDEWQRMTPNENLVRDTVDSVQYPTGVSQRETKTQGYVADPMKQDNGDSQHESSGMPGRDWLATVAVGPGAFSPMANDPPVAMLTQTASHGSVQLHVRHERMQEERMGFAPNQIDQLSDRFAEHSLRDHQPIPHRLPENELDPKESVLPPVAAHTGPVLSSGFVGPVKVPSPVSRVQPEHTAPEPDLTLPFQPVAPLVAVTASSQFSEQPHVAGRSLMYFPNTSPPGEQAEQNVGGQTALPSQLSGQSQVLPGVDVSQSRPSLLDLSVPQLSRPSEIIYPHSVPSSTPVVSSGVLPVTTAAGNDIKLSNSLPVSGTTTVYHGSEPKTNNRPVMQETLPPDIEQSVSTPVQERSPSQPVEATKMLSGGPTHPTPPSPMTSTAQADRTVTDGSCQVHAAGPPQTVLSTVSQTDGHYHTQAVTSKLSPSAPNAVIFSSQLPVQTEQSLQFQAPVMASSSSQVPMFSPAPNVFQSAVPETLSNEVGKHPVVSSTVVTHPLVQAASISAPKVQHQQPSSLQPAVVAAAVGQEIVPNAAFQQMQQLSTVTNAEIQIQAQQMVPALSMVSQMSSSGLATHQSGIPQSTVSGGMALQPHLQSQHQIQPITHAGLGMSQSFYPSQHPVSEVNNELRQHPFQAAAPTQVHPHTAVGPSSVSSMVTPSQQTLQTSLSAAAVQSQRFIQPDVSRPVAPTQPTVFRQTGNVEQQPLVVATQTLKPQQDIQSRHTITSTAAVTQLGPDQQIMQSQPQEAVNPQAYHHTAIGPASAAFHVNPPSQQNVLFAQSGTPAVQSQQSVQPEVRRPEAPTQPTLLGRTGNDIVVQQPRSFSTQAIQFQQDVQSHAAIASTVAVSHLGPVRPSSTPSLQDNHLRYDEQPSTYGIGQTFLANRSHPSAFHEPVRAPVHGPHEWPPGYPRYSDRYPPERERSGQYGGYRGYGNEYYNQYYEQDHYYRHRHYGRYDPYSSGRQYHSYHHHPDDEQRWREHDGYQDYHDHYRRETDGHSGYDSRYYNDHYHDNYQSEYENRSTVDADYQPDVSSIHGGDDYPALESTAAVVQDASHYADYDGRQHFDPSQHYDGSFLDPATAGFYTADAPWEPVQSIGRVCGVSVSVVATVYVSLLVHGAVTMSVRLVYLLLCLYLC